MEWICGFSQGTIVLAASLIHIDRLALLTPAVKVLCDRHVCYGVTLLYFDVQGRV